MSLIPQWDGKQISSMYDNLQEKHKKSLDIFRYIRYILDIVRSFGQYNHIKFFNLQFLAL